MKKHEKTQKNDQKNHSKCIIAYLTQKTQKTKKTQKTVIFGIFRCFCMFLSVFWWKLMIFYKTYLKSLYVFEYAKMQKTRKNAKKRDFFIFFENRQNRDRKTQTLLYKEIYFKVFFKFYSKSSFSSFLTIFWWHIGDLWGKKDVIFMFFHFFKKSIFEKTVSSRIVFFKNDLPAMLSKIEPWKCTRARIYIYTPRNPLAPFGSGFLGFFTWDGALDPYRTSISL